MMSVKNALDWLNHKQWMDTTADMRLDLLHQLQNNVDSRMDALVAADCAIKHIDLQDPTQAHLLGSSMQSVIMPMANNIRACIEVYERLAKGKFPEPARMLERDDGYWDIQVFPTHARDKAMFMDRRDYLRVRGEPLQWNPMDHDGGIIAVLGAGNFSSMYEVLRALFLDNCACVVKPHAINREASSVWEDVFEPLVDMHALSFCDVDSGETLLTQGHFQQVYFTGDHVLANQVLSRTDSPSIVETGSNNPCIIVPGDVPWTTDDMHHHALHIATYAKLNGGAECARPQTLVTCRKWSQRDQFLRALERALLTETPAVTSFYPASVEQFHAFKSQYPDVKPLLPENTKDPHAEFLWLNTLPEESYAHQHEAFSQVLCEVPLNTEDDPREFLNAAVQFCNQRLKGRLSCSILMDEVTQSHHADSVDQAISDLQYGLVSVNSLPTYGWLNPYLSWGAHGFGDKKRAGAGNFGNMMNFQNVHKSISYSGFRSPSHLLMENKKQWLRLSKDMSHYAIHPSWLRLGSMSMTLFTGRMRTRDF